MTSNISGSGNRRTQGRYLCADIVRIDWIASEDEMRTFEAVIDDISPSGASFELEEPLPSGASVVVWLREALFAGVVRHCMFRDYTYIAGVEFSEGSKWSSTAVQPHHLTNLRELAAEQNARQTERSPSPPRH